MAGKFAVVVIALLGVLLIIYGTATMTVAPFLYLDDKPDNDLTFWQIWSAMPSFILGLLMAQVAVDNENKFREYEYD